MLGGWQQALEHAARISQADDHNIVRVGYVVAEQDTHDSQLHVFAPRLARRIAAGSRHAGQEREEPSCFGFQNAQRRQAGQRLVANVTAPPGEMRHPEAGVLSGLGLGDFLEHGVQQVVAQRRRVQH